MSRVVMVVPRARGYCGRLVLLGTDGRTRLGPLRVLATASRRVARRHGNATCDPLRPFGHPPAGSYLVSTSLPPGYAHPRRPRRFGPLGALLLAPTKGDAVASLANGRRIFAVHGGPLDSANRLRPTRGGFRLSDPDLGALLLAINAANADADPVDHVEVIEVGDADVRSVPAMDLRGARRAAGIPHKARARRGHAKEGAMPGALLLVMLGGGAVAAGKHRVGRRALLQMALMAVGGLAASACSNQASPCTPLACDPGDGGLGDGASPDGRVIADAGVAEGGNDGGGDGGRPRPDGGVPTAPDGGTVIATDGGYVVVNGPCPPSGYVCEEDGTYVDDGTYVGAGGGVG